MSSRRTVRRFLAASSSAQTAYTALVKRPPGGEKTWTRTNHRGEAISLLEGPAAALGAVTAALVVPGLEGTQRLALACAGAGAGAVGCYDDLAGSRDSHGFRGHLGALARGEVTTGTVKIAGIGAAALVSAILISGQNEGQGAVGRGADILIDTALIAGSANLVNLFDLRPGRAIKVSLLASLALAAAGPDARAAVAAPAGAATALLTEDLGERAMLGDCGANALGAMLGVAAASSLGRPARLASLVGVAGLTAASEKVSFTKVIERTPALRWADMLGRRPVQSPAPADPADQPEGGTPLAPDSTAG
jgi:UDP-N-acetylmuramyl pentapeptide phosphotransferase/UDP-N-acetylglucosamine-1-phosphate transferase